MRTAERHRNSERLTFGDDNIGAALARRFQKPERNRFRDDDNQQCADGVSFFRQTFEIFDTAEKVWRLHDESGGFIVEFI